jgi:hypothetical protein
VLGLRISAVGAGYVRASEYLGLDRTWGGSMSKCQGVTKGGASCGQDLGPDREFCVWHDPSLSPDKRHRLAVRGGLARGRKALSRLPAETPIIRLDSPEAIRELLSLTVHDVRLGHLAPRVAHAVFAGVAQALRLAELEVGSMITDLERALERKR